MTAKKAYIAGGCFWGMEDLFRERPGVLDTEVGYTGGTEPRPTYQNHTGHAEAIEITYDDEQTSFRELLEYLFRIHNPTTPNQQGNDRGVAYRSAIFYQNEEEKQIAQDVIEMVEASEKWPDPVVTTLEPKSEFFEAEAYHQDYLKRNIGGYTCHMEYFDSYT